MRTVSDGCFLKLTITIIIIYIYYFLTFNNTCQKKIRGKWYNLRSMFQFEKVTLKYWYTLQNQVYKCIVSQRLTISTGWKVSVFGFFLVCADKKNSKYGHFLHSAKFLKTEPSKRNLTGQTASETPNLPSHNKYSKEYKSGRLCFA